MKKTTLSFLLFLLVNFSFSQEISEYLSGLNSPISMTLDGSIIYVSGPKDIYAIDTSAGSPSATLIYTLPADFYTYKTQKLGNDLFILVEEWIESTDTYEGMHIVKLDVTDIAAGPQVVISSDNFIASFVLVGNTMYYSDEQEDVPGVLTTNIYSFDATQSSPTPTLAFSDIDLGDVSVDDVEVFDNVMYISSGEAEKIFTLDLSTSTAEPEEYLNTTVLNFNKGIFISSAGYLYITNAHEIEKGNVNDLAANLEFIGSQTTYYDVHNGNPYLANFRDVVLIGNTLYMTLEEQGKVVTLTDTTLGTSDVSQGVVGLYPNPVSSDLFLVNNTEFKEFGIFDLTGKRVTYGIIKSNMINFSNLVAGVYLLNLKGTHGQKNFKIIKQ